MAVESPTPKAVEDEVILQQQFRRALSSFEGIILSQIDIKNRLGDRLNYSIQAGIIIIGAVSLSFSVLLFTLTSQIDLISGIVGEMNAHFISVSGQMGRIRGYMGDMERRVALLQPMENNMALMDREIGAIRFDIEQMRGNVDSIDNYLAAVRTHVGNISVNMDLMNLEVQAMSVDMLKVSRPARTMNKMFPFP